jgi:hypothetical protein
MAVIRGTAGPTADAIGWSRPAPIATLADRLGDSVRAFELQELRGDEAPRPMSTSGRYTINAPDVVAEDLNGEVVILNLANGHYFSLRGIASGIWTSLLAGHAPQAILASIGSRRPALLEASSAFVARLVDLALVRPRDETDAAAEEPIDDPWIGEAPAIEVYDDLAELIFADPIHDVDEQAGWPTPRPTP